MKMAGAISKTEYVLNIVGVKRTKAQRKTLWVTNLKGTEDKNIGVLLLY